MKTAISIPDEIFDAAEQFAKRFGIPRSELYSRAVEAYVQHHRRQGVKKALDLVYTSEESELDPVLHLMQLASLPRKDW